VNLLLHTSIFWKLPANCHIYIIWPVGQKYLGHAGINYSGNEFMTQQALFSCLRTARYEECSIYR